MEVILGILKPIVIPILKLISIALIIYMAYSHVFNLGVAAEKERSNKEKIVLQTRLDERTNQLIDKSTEYVTSSQANSIKSQELVNNIIENMKYKPSVIYKEGKCSVTEDVKQTYKALIEEANKK